MVTTGTSLRQIQRSWITLIHRSGSHNRIETGPFRTFLLTLMNKTEINSKFTAKSLVTSRMSEDTYFLLLNISAIY